MNLTRKEEKGVMLVTLTLVTMFSIGVGLHFHSFGAGLIAFPVALVIMKLIVH